MKQPDAFSRHEALHMSLFLAEAVEQQLALHPFVLSNPDCKVLADRAVEVLNELYQAVGAK